MIQSLHISNYALIDSLDIDFGEGLNIITGETGAGKSIIIGALSQLLGERADMKAVRNAGKKSIIEAQFAIADSPALRGILREEQLDGADDGVCVLRRELLPGGRSRAFVNDTPVNLDVLRRVALNLVDIHSQHRNHLLATADYQIGIIDTLAGNGTLLGDYKKAFEAYKVALGEYTATRDMIKRHRDDADYIAFQYAQLDSLTLSADEDVTLERERELLANAGRIKSLIQLVADPLSEAQPNVLGQLQQAVRALEALSAAVGDGNDTADFRSLAERLDSARIEIADIAGTVAAYDATLDADPGRLDEIDQRLALIYSLETRHHVDSVAALVDLQAKLAGQLKALQDSDTVLVHLENAARHAKKEAVTIAEKLSAARTVTAQEFAQRLRATAATLGMPNLRCDITMTRGKLCPTGYDRLQFLFAFNKNQALVPVDGTASGGEISRLMLSIKAIIADKMQLPSIIFDEIDTGVSGDIAVRMAKMMKDISRTTQVLAITHLPGVAAMGDRHFKVFKQDDETSTTTHIRLLNRRQRRSELALMLSGVPDDPAALSAADSLLQKAGVL